MDHVPVAVLHVTLRVPHVLHTEEGLEAAGHSFSTGLHSPAEATLHVPVCHVPVAVLQLTDRVPHSLHVVDGLLAAEHSFTHVFVHSQCAALYAGHLHWSGLHSQPVGSSSHAGALQFPSTSTFSASLFG